MLKGDHLTVSDGGETIARLSEASFDITDSTMAVIWAESLRTYRLYQTEGRVFIQTPLSEAAHALNRFADALTALDGLRVIGVPPASKSKSLADEIGDYLASLYDEVLSRPVDEFFQAASSFSS